MRVPPLVSAAVTAESLVLPRAVKGYGLPAVSAEGIRLHSLHGDISRLAVVLQGVGAYPRQLRYPDVAEPVAHHSVYRDGL